MASGPELLKNLHAQQSDDDDDDDDEETTNTLSSKSGPGLNGQSNSGATAGANNMGHADEAELKKRKKLELNRIASRESRKRKKRRVEELQRSVLFLTHENHQLREQNELLRQMLVGRLPSATTGVTQAALVSGAAAGTVPTSGVDGQGQSLSGAALAQASTQQQPQQVQAQSLPLPQPTPPPLPPAQHFSSHHLMPQLSAQVAPPQLLSGLSIVGGGKNE